MDKGAAIWIVLLTTAAGLIFLAEWILGPVVTEAWIPAGMAIMVVCAIVWFIGYAFWTLFKKS